MEEHKNPIIQMTDNNGNTVHAEVYDVFDFENHKYALLIPIDGEKEDGKQTLAVMRLMLDGDSYYIEEIPTDEEFNRVSKYLQGPIHEGDCNCDCHHEEHHCCGGSHHQHDDDCCCGGGHHHHDDDDDCCCGGGHCCEH